MHRCYNCWHDQPCYPVKNYTVYKIEDYGWLKPNADEIKAEIFHHGPISCSILANPLVNNTGEIATDPNDHITHAISVKTQIFDNLKPISAGRLGRR
jgi:hypothetical protein